MTAPSVRRLMHAATGTTLLLVPVVSWQLLRAVLIALAAVAVAVEVVRLRSPRFREMLAHRVPVFRAREAGRPSGAMWLAVGYALAALTPLPGPTAGILVGAVADPAAAWVGSRSGPTGQKTGLGSATHFVVATALLLGLGCGWLTSVAAAVVATVLERWPLGLDDNLLVAPATALTVVLLR